MSTEEVPLRGGNATAGVVRVGDTVRKPWNRSTPDVAWYLGGLAAHGVPVPTTSGRDERGRQVLEYIPGVLAESVLPLDGEGLRRVGAMIRDIHEASPPSGPSGPGDWEVLLPAPVGDDAVLVCHNDLAPWNLVVGERWVFIDWDGAGPSTRLWDLAYAAQSFAMVAPTEPVEDASARLADLVDGYGADDALREALPATMARRAEAMATMLREAREEGREPWGSLHDAGHGAYWASVADFVEVHLDEWHRALRA